MKKFYEAHVILAILALFITACGTKRLPTQTEEQPPHKYVSFEGVLGKPMTGVFAAHSYKFDKTTSTFIVECDPQTWNQAGFATMSDADTRAYLGNVFASDLAGHSLLSNNSKWINFVLVKNANWHFEDVVLLGDALHTAHFSIGSGTKLAMEDAIALKQCFDDASAVSGALQRFEQTRKPVIEDYQAAAYESMRWFENAREYISLSPVDLAYSLMKRSGRVDDEELRKRDSGFVAAYESAKSA